MDRRYFFKASLAGGAALATGAATCPAQARDNKPLPSEALGLLFDSTLCVGCKACACPIVIASLRCTSTSAPSTRKACTRL